MNQAMESLSRSTNHTRDANGRLHDSMGRFVRESGHVTTSSVRLRGGFGGLTASVGSLSSGFGGLAVALLSVASAYGVVAASQKAFNATVGQAMTFEQSEVKINSMLGNQKGARFMQMLQDYALESPVLESNDLMAYSSKLLANVEHTDENFSKIFESVEKVTALNTNRGLGGGTEGAAYALNAFVATGDVQSLVERFDIPRNVLNDIKDNFEEPIDRMNEVVKWFDSRFGDELIKKMGNTSLGKWSQVRERWDLMLREMGEPSLGVVADFANDVLKRLEGEDATKFADIGAKWIKNILEGLTNRVIDVYDWFTTMTNSQKWKDATTMSAKVNIIIENLLDRFNKWYEDHGKKHLESAATTLINALATSLEKNSGPIASAAISIGGKIGEGIVSGLWSAIKKDPIASGVLSGNPIGFLAGKAGKWLGEQGNKFTTKASEYMYGNENAHNGGLDRVPYNNYRSILHKDEAVLTRNEARDYRDGKKNGNTYQFNVTFTGAGSNEQDAEKMFEWFVKKVEAAGGAGA